MIITGLTASMAVNTLVTGLIVYRILSVERTLGSSSLTTGGTKLRHIIFIIIESGMALFVIQLVRVVLTSLESETPSESVITIIGLDLVIFIHQMLNVI